MILIHQLLKGISGFHERSWSPVTCGILVGIMQFGMM